jgi:hypothetical protein
MFVRNQLCGFNALRLKKKKEQELLIDPVALQLVHMLFKRTW